MLEQTVCDSTEEADLVQEAIPPKLCEKAARELHNSPKRKKAGLNSKRCKMAARGSFFCPKCNRKYRYRMSLKRHLNFECGKEPSWACLYCKYAALYKTSLQAHIRRCHKDKENVL
jgi:hypothetical protein